MEQSLRSILTSKTRQIRKCGENRVLPTKPRFYPGATCGFIGKNGLWSTVFDFSRTSDNREFRGEMLLANIPFPAGKVVSPRLCMHFLM